RAERQETRLEPLPLPLLPQGAPPPGRGQGARPHHADVVHSPALLLRTQPRVPQGRFVGPPIARQGGGLRKVHPGLRPYEGRHAADDAKPFVRGINSFELFFDGKRWWIFAIVWQPETAKLALPPEEVK